MINVNVSVSVPDGTDPWWAQEMIKALMSDYIETQRKLGRDISRFKEMLGWEFHVQIKEVGT